MSFKAVPKEIKDQILIRVKEGVPVRQLSQEHGVSTKTVYAWLARLSGEHPSRLAYGRVKKERDELMKLVGKLSLELSRGEKNRSG